MSELSIITVFDDPEAGLKGNTSAVIRLEEAPGFEKMQEIASHLNQPATTFLWPAGSGSWNIRWFAPDAEIGLCGHGTLAAVAFLNQEVKLLAKNDVTLFGRPLDENKACMELDAIPVIEKTDAPVRLADALGVNILGYYRTSNKDIVLVEDEQTLTGMRPDFSALASIDIFGYAVTAPGEETDFVSRTLVPHVRQLEDHATGSSHAALVPFWAHRLSKNNMTAIQRSPRGGRFDCTLDGHKVILNGHFSVLVTGTYDL